MTELVAWHRRRVPTHDAPDSQGIVLTVLKARRFAEQAGIHNVQLTLTSGAPLAMEYIYKKLQAEGCTNCAFDDQHNAIVINLT